MALGDSYATLAEIKTRMGITVSSNDTQLTEALAAASRGIELFCDRQFNKAGSLTARMFHATGRTFADVDDFHTTTGLVIKTDDSSDGVFETTWTTGDYELEPLNGIVSGELGWPYSRIVAVNSRWFPCSRRAQLEVTADWGWAAVPARVKEATLAAAEELFKMKDAPFGVTGFTEWGPVRVRENPFVRSLIAAYRHFPVLVG